MTYKANYKSILSQLKLKKEQSPEYIQHLILKFDEALAEWEKSDEENKAYFFWTLAQSDVVICAKLVEFSNKVIQEQQTKHPVKTEKQAITKPKQKVNKQGKQEVKQEPEKVNKNKLEELIRKAQELKSKI